MKIRYLFLIIVLLIIVFVIYYYPYQRFMALRDFNKYITAQGIDENNIQSKEVFKDYMQDGYIINVVYSDDSNLVYKYKWYIGNTIHKNTYNIYLMIFRDAYSIELLPNVESKYPVLDNTNLF